MAWIGGNRYLNQSEMENNVTELWNWFSVQLGASPHAVAAMAGNMQSESTVNPQIWENLEINEKKGYGLVQWTPATKLINWAAAQDPPMDYAAGDTQCERIFYEMVEKIQWYPTRKYPMTFQEFMFSEDSPYDLAMAFLYNYERPENKNQPNRGTQAESWYTFITGLPPPPRKRLGMPLYMMMRRM